MNWHEVVKLLRDIFAYADVQLVVYTCEENGSHTMFAKGDTEFYADCETKRQTEKVFHGNHEMETAFTKDSKSCQPTYDE